MTTSTLFQPSNYYPQNVNICKMQTRQMLVIDEEIELGGIYPMDDVLKIRRKWRREIDQH